MWSYYGHPDDDYIAWIDQDSQLWKYTVCMAHEGEDPFETMGFDDLDQAKAWAKEKLNITHWRDCYGRFTAKPI